MQKVKSIIFLILLFSLIGVANAKTINVSPGEDIQTTLNQCFPGDTVHLLEGTHKIGKQLVIPQGVTLEGTMKGDSWQTTLFLEANAKFARQEPIIRSDADYVTICYIHLDCNSENQPSGINMGDGYYNGIGLFYGTGHSIHDNWIDNGLGDHIRLRSCTDVEIYNNKITRAGHEGIFFVMCERVLVHDNYIEPRDNTAVRLWGGHSIRIYANTVYFSRTDFEGNSQTACHAFQVQMDEAKKMSDIEICGNYVSGMLVSDIWAVDKTGEKTEDPVWIHHNVFQNGGGGNGWGSGGIIINGLNCLIEHNVFDGTEGSAVSIQSYKGAWGTDTEVDIKNNIFTNINSWKKTGSGGYGIQDSISADISTQYNCFYAVQSGNAHGCKLSSSDYFTNPKTEDTECDIVWKNGKWVIPGVKPKEFEGSGRIYDDDDKVTDEEIQEFDDIFDILNVEFTDTGRTEQTADDIKLEVEKTTKGFVAGGIKIVGFKDQIILDNTTYIPDENSVLVKYKVIKSPDLEGWTGHIKKIEKNVKVEMKDGMAYATLTVKTSWYTIKKDTKTGEKKKSKIKTSTATFKDSCPSPMVLERETSTHGYVHVYDDTKNPFAKIIVPHTNTTSKIEVTYGENKTTRTLMLGERIRGENGVIYTIFNKCDRWAGGVPHAGYELIIHEKFDKSKLHIEYFTPYESFEVTDIDIIYHETKEENNDKATINFILHMILVLLAGYKIMDTIIN